MEKVEKNLISNQSSNDKRNKNLIKASTILEITLEDYHQSRKLYGQGTSNVNLDNFKQGDEINSNIANNLKNENLFDEFEEETNEYNNNKRISFNQIGNKKENVNVKENKYVPNTMNNLNVNNNSNVNKNVNLPKQDLPKNQQDKISKLKNIIFNFIKERELDM
jgi:hypothetical protein